MSRNGTASCRFGLMMLPWRTSRAAKLGGPNPRVQRTRASASLRREPLTRHPLGDLIVLWWLVGGMLPTCACVSNKPPPSDFNAWGAESPIAEPDRSVVIAAIGALPDPKEMVVARYAGDTRRRLDLSPLVSEIPATLDLDTRLAEIDNGPSARRARAFAKAFPGKTTVLVLAAPDLHEGWATITAWVWNARAWECWLPGRAEYLTLTQESDQWRVTDSKVVTDVSLAQSDCD